MEICKMSRVQSEVRQLGYQVCFSKVLCFPVAGKKDQICQFVITLLIIQKKICAEKHNSNMKSEKLIHLLLLGLKL